MVNNIILRHKRDTLPTRGIQPCIAESCSIPSIPTQREQHKLSENELQLTAVPIGELRKIPDSVTLNPINNAANWYFRNISSSYKVVDNKGINAKNARDIDICLAKYSQKVAEAMDVSSTCYTGVKHALWNAGIISDYADMPKGSAHEAKNYFDSQPEKFQKLNISAKDLKNLPAGVIIVYTKAGKDGHIAITNGYGQEMSDSTDNMGWLEQHGKGAAFTAYKLTDKWQYNRNTMKLEFKG